MLTAMQRQRAEEVDRLANILGRLEVEHQTSIRGLTNRLQQFSINERKRLDERTASIVCDNLVREMEAQERADRAAVDRLIAQAREIEIMAKRNLKPIGTSQAS